MRLLLVEDVNVQVYTAGSHTFVVINDTGPVAGNSASDRQRVFDRFYRHEGGSTVGSGLDRAIVLALARQHGDLDTPCGCTRIAEKFGACAARH